jgi:hypothetical protein
MKTKTTTQIQIDENQRNCIVSGLIYLQLEMRKETLDKPEDHDRNQWLLEQILMMSRMIKELEEKFK